MINKQELIFEDKIWLEMKKPEERSKWEVQEKKLLAYNFRLHLAISSVKWWDPAANLVLCLNLYSNGYHFYKIRCLNKEKNSHGNQLPNSINFNPGTMQDNINFNPGTMQVNINFKPGTMQDDRNMLTCHLNFI